MALRPGAGASGAAGAGTGPGGAGSFMFPVAGGMRPPQGLIPMQQQGFPMVSVMQPNMQGMMGMNYSSQMSQGPIAMQAGIPMGPMPAAGVPFLGQPPFLGMRPAAPQYTPDMQKQFAEEQQKRFEQQQKLLEEERKRRQFEEQKQKLRLLSSVKPKTGEKNRDDALEAIKGNLDGFSRDAKMHPTPASHPKKPDCPTSSHSTKTVSPSSAFLGEDEFSGFMQGPVELPTCGPSSTAQPFQSFLPSTPLGQLHTQKAGAQPLPPGQAPVSFAVHGVHGQIPCLSAASASHSVQKAGPSLEEKLLVSCDISASGQEHIKLSSPEAGHRAVVPGSSKNSPGLMAHNGGAVDGCVSGPTTAVAEKTSDQNLSKEESGVGVFPSQDPVQPRMPPWIYNESLVPDAYKKILETTMTPTGIDTAKLYPILMSSGLPRETLGQIWALANRTTPGKLTKEELYTVLAMVAVTQRGVPAMSPDTLNQFPAAPIPTLSGFPMTLPTPVSQPTAMTSGPAGSIPLSLGQPIMGINLVGPVGGAAAPTSSGFMPAYPSNQVGKTEEDDFQDFQDASKSGSIDDSFTDFQEVPASSKTSNSQHGNSAPSLLIPLPGTKASTDKYAVFKGISAEKPSENPASFGESGDKYSAFRELEPTADSKPLGESFAEFRSTGTDDGFTDFKTADSVSPLEPPTKDSFPSAFASGAAQQTQTQVKTPLNLADLDMFSSVDCSGEKPVPFSAAFSTSKSVSSRPQPAGSAAAPASLASTKASSLADDFGEFNLFGEYSNPASVGEQDDFADFMAFGNSSIPSEPKADDKYEALREEGSPGALSTSTVEGAHNPPVSSSKYDVFKQLSLEGAGLAIEEFKENTPSTKSDGDFADFHSSKFSSTSSDKSLGEKAVAFRHAKEDSASVKSLDLPSIGGSSVGKEDSEDALSVQFDMKLADVGGDLKHVMSDSSLDLPTVSGQHPPAAAGSGSSATSNLQRKEISFGSSENITMSSLSKGSALASEDALPETPFPAFASFKDMMPQTTEQKEYETGDFQDFTRQDMPMVDRSQENTCPSPASSVASHETPKEGADDFGEFQSEKPKISKFDFLVANSQSKMKSSEEMIKSELATFDLSVQGSHKRSLSLGDKEISRSSPSPALEQPFRDRSNTLSERAALPVIRDKYKDLTGEVEENERYAYEWQRCLGSALDVIKKANDTLNGISSSAVCTEVIQSAQGMEYLLGVVEVYRVTKRVELGIKATAVCSEKLQQLLKDIDKVWNNLIGFMSLTTLTPDENSLDFSSCMLRPGIKNAQELACGVCLLNVDSRSRGSGEAAEGVNRVLPSLKEETPAEEQPKKAFNSETDSFKLAYGGHQYHASCANFWINCVEPKPPGLLLPDLL
ncbi:synergin gamma isoform X1 [Rattus norvegicus]|uniref:synergin gamma isoform X1 n=1 Tax=Rattus norvegicus TaxID=10116 RepID=UPI0019176856|nr:synergin gamma isoform X1 [Rattus norvegicus]